MDEVCTLVLVWFQSNIFVPPPPPPPPPPPGMIAAMTRHLKSLRYLQRDYGWIHTLLEEAENERMHLLTALELRRPGPLFKGMIILSQGT